ncbi:RNA ligase, family, partial [Candidatus Magnetobacterium bavaricum]
NADNEYARIYYQYNLRSIVEDNMIIYGEIYGSGIQKLKYGYKDGKIAFAVFDIKKDDMYLNWTDVEEFCKRHKLPVVPVLYRGKFSDEIVKSHIHGKSVLADHVKEGIVVKPLIERSERSERIIRKYVNEEFLMKDYGDLH